MMEWNMSNEPRRKIGNWSLDEYAWESGRNVQYNHDTIKGLQLHLNKVFSSRGDHYEVYLYRYRVYFKSKFIKKFPSLSSAYSFAQSFMEEVSDSQLKTGDY